MTPQAKSRRGMLAVILIANLLSCAQFFFVSAKAGLFGLIVTTIRSFAFWALSGKDKQISKWVLFLFIALQLSSTVVGWDNLWSLLTLSLILNTYGQWQSNIKTLRICLLISAVFMGIYCIVTGAYTGALNKFLQAGSTVIALWRFGKGNKEVKNSRDV
jgi:hypothetical protein